MFERINASKTKPTILGGIILLASLLLWFAPLERTLGAGIKIVYIHVALIWTGMTGLALLGILGLGILLTAQQKLQAWTQTIGWVALGFFAAGIGISTIAAKVNWGAVFWQEPRTVAMLQVLAVGIIVQVANSWPIWPRLKGLFSVLVVAFLSWSLLNTPLVLHPRNPARTSPSLGIQLSFFGLFLLSCLAASWLVLYFQQPDATISGSQRQVD